MTPEEHFAEAEKILGKTSGNSWYAEMHTALGRALSEHEARKADAKWGTKGSDWVYGEVPPVCGTCDSQHVGTCPAEEPPDSSTRAEAGKAYNRQANRTAAHDDDINKLNAVINARTAERNTARENESALEEKVRRLAQDVQLRDASITQLLLKLETADQLARNLRSEIESWQEISDNNARALFAANEAAANEAADQLALITVGPPAALLGPETVTVDFGGNGLGSKSRRIYGALRPAEQVWRTPKATKWRGLRGRWAVDADVVSDVAEVFARSVDYPDTDEVGVDLVTWPKDLEPSRRSHDTLEILNRQRMSRTAWATHPDNIGDMEHP